ncbi:MAG: HugZ family protein [Rhizobiaceae bacterium]|nr:HugZ family protein [Rhizobiaceae bacterium]MCV0407766.1 HugZ family protein [Rhizobiaceae bacterium]
MNRQPKDVIRETDAEAIALARTLLRTARHGALAVLSPEDGAPLASRTAVATDHDGSPIILVSSLSAHTGALRADPRCSLLLGEPGKGDPLAHPRITLSCVARELRRGTPDQSRAESRYLARQPKAKLYAGFGDFSYFRLEIGKTSLNGGFGKAYLLTAADMLTASPALDAIAAMEAGAVAHMNEDHRDAIAVYARVFARPRPDRLDGDWVLTGIDPDGIDLMDGDRVARVPFERTLMDAAEVRPTLVKLAKDGRAAGE